MALLRRVHPWRIRAGSAVRAALALAVSMPAGAQVPQLSVQEYQLKAAFLYNFAKFVEWPAPPAGANGSLVIVVFGRDPFGPALERTVWGKSVNGRSLAVRRTSRVQEVMPCHMLFVSAQEARRAPEVLQAVERSGVLTVSDTEDFVDRGGAVRFVTDDNKVRFEINLGAVRRSGLNISSRLLSLARAVKN